MGIGKDDSLGKLTRLRPELAYLHMDARIEDIYDIKVKRNTLSFSWGGALRFVFDTEARAHECCRVLTAIREQITEAKG